MTNQEKLMQAFELVDEVQRTMDCLKTPCDHCGVGRYNNWDETTFSKRLTAVKARLKSTMDEMKRKGLERHTEGELIPRPKRAQGRLSGK
jgi:hypothetical protein